MIVVHMVGVVASSALRIARALCLLAFSFLPLHILTVIYFNARSLFHELCLVVEMHHPDIICIVESWLSPEICDHEIAIPGYEHRRCDRNRHGGGVIIYVSQKYVIKQLSSHPMLEILTVVINNKNFKCCLSLFYRPPNSHMDVICMLQSYLEFIDVSQFSLFILVGDFNIDVLENVCHPLCSMLSLFGLSQIVDHPTHIHNNLCKSLIDLVFLSDVSKCQVIPPLSNSDHLGLQVEIKTKLKKTSCKQTAKRSMLCGIVLMMLLFLLSHCHYLNITSALFF